MFARILDCAVKPEKTEDFVRVVKNEVLPILDKQTGFLEVLPFFPVQTKEERVITISLWATKADAERYEKEYYPKVQEIIKSYLTTPIVVRPYTVETTLCQHLVEALAEV